jgi:hypothetical protein
VPADTFRSGHQLRVLDTSLKDIAKSAFAGDAEALMTDGRFLQSRRE